MDDKKLETVRYYDQEATSWAATHGGDETETWWKDEMKKFNEYLPSGRIIEIGSGIGKDAKSLIDLGYDYIGIDPSVGFLELAQKRCPSGKFIKKYAHEINPSLGEFDGFWASAVLLHIPRDEMNESLLAISSVLRKGAIGFIVMKEGEGERIDSETGRLFTYYQEDEFRTVLEWNGFEVLDTDRRDTEKNNYLIYYVKKEN